MLTLLLRFKSFITLNSLSRLQRRYCSLSIPWFTLAYHLLFKRYRPPMKASFTLNALTHSHVTFSKNLRFYSIHYAILSSTICHLRIKLSCFTPMKCKNKTRISRHITRQVWIMKHLENTTKKRMDRNFHQYSWFIMEMLFVSFLQHACSPYESKKHCALPLHIMHCDRMVNA